MPPKKKNQPIEPSYDAPKMAAQPMKVSAPVAVQTENAVALGVFMICCTCLALVFGASFMAAAASLTTTQPTVAARCQDTDNGKNFNVFGAVNYLNANSRIYNYADTCLSNSLPVAECTDKTKKCGIKEYLCSADKTASVTLNGSSFWTECPLGCRDGACIQPLICTDSDTAFIQSNNSLENEYYLKGSTTGWAPQGYSVVKSDFCSNSDSMGVSNTLSEYYCDSNNYVALNSITCDYGCENGACKYGPTQMITLDGVDFILSNPSVDATFYDNNGDSTFTFSIIPSQRVNYSFTAGGYGVGFPTYGILGGISSGSGIGEVKFERYFNDEILNASNGTTTFSGYLPIKITYDGKTGELRLPVKATVLPFLRENYCSVNIDNRTFRLAECGGGATMVDGKGDYPFKITIVPSDNEPYAFSVVSYRGNFPDGGVKGEFWGGGATGIKVLNYYYSDAALNSSTSSYQSFNGYIPIKISTLAGASGELRYGITAVAGKDSDYCPSVMTYDMAKQDCVCLSGKFTTSTAASTTFGCIQ